MLSMIVSRYAILLTTERTLRPIVIGCLEHLQATALISYLVSCADFLLSQVRNLKLSLRCLSFALLHLLYLRCITGMKKPGSRETNMASCIGLIVSPQTESTTQEVYGQMDRRPSVADVRNDATRHKSVSKKKVTGDS